MPATDETAPDKKDRETSDQQETVPALTAPRREDRPVPRARKRRSLLLIIVLLVLILAGLAFFFRDMIAQFVSEVARETPQVTSSANTLGAEETNIPDIPPPPSLEITELSSLVENVGPTERVLMLKGVIANKASSVQPVPEVIAEVLDVNGNTIEELRFAMPFAAMEPGETQPFSHRWLNPPAGVHQLRINFAYGEPLPEASTP